MTFLLGVRSVNKSKLETSNFFSFFVKKMDKIRACGCKGCRTCLICEKEYNIEEKSFYNEFKVCYIIVIKFLEIQNDV